MKIPTALQAADLVEAREMEIDPDHATSPPSCHLETVTSTAEPTCGTPTHPQRKTTSGTPPRKTRRCRRRATQRKEETIHTTSDSAQEFPTLSRAGRKNRKNEMQQGPEALRPRLSLTIVHHIHSGGIPAYTRTTPAIKDLRPIRVGFPVDPVVFCHMEQILQTLTILTSTDAFPSQPAESGSFPQNPSFSAIGSEAYGPFCQTDQTSNIFVWFDRMMISQAPLFIPNYFIWSLFQAYFIWTGFGAAEVSTFSICDAKRSISSQKRDFIPPPPPTSRHLPCVSCTYNYRNQYLNSSVPFIFPQSQHFARQPANPTLRAKFKQRFNARVRAIKFTKIVNILKPFFVLQALPMFHMT